MSYVPFEVEAHSRHCRDEKFGRELIFLNSVTSDVSFLLHRKHHATD